MNTKLCVLFVLAFVTWPCQGSDYQVFPLRMKTGYNEQYPTEVSCASWRLGVEANNLVKWKTVPAPCQEHVADYLLGDQYRSDSKTVCREAYFYAKTLNITQKDIFVFDVDDTALSNLQYFANHGFGVEEHNATAFKIWVSYGEAFALPETLKLYNKLLALGIKVVFITERPLDLKDVTVSNLQNVGFYKWDKLIARDPSIYSGKLSNAFKSSERSKLAEEGYRIVGNIGDQWSDILGDKRGFRTFKLPNPLYYD
ncbi:stem 31 kDa glycoprotein-like [Vigna umbellata]|uniref:stem 31 kDa glycoprotein-like n=1 Tax=Vigna umbellata TaxID=87088 RepID=UPI001F5EEFE6|nr:stem 31 kDa glycoprotein-like [Vigna umbellata]